jgi:prepilin-type N-terminal cleavage/methylation domain-containing protein/prepilin-type processing-associated H-X9-DG protein
MKKNAFTLVELLVVIAIIALLLAILMPSLRKVRAQAQTVVCGTRMKQLATADIMYAHQYGATAPPCRFAFGLPFDGKWYDQSWTNFRKYWNYGKLRGDLRYKAFTTGNLYPFLKNGEVFVCPAIPKTGRPPVPPGGKEYPDRVFGFDSHYNYTPRWSYVNNVMPGGCQPAGQWDYSINPDMVKPSPSNVFLFMDEGWDSTWLGHDNTMVFFMIEFDKSMVKSRMYDILSPDHNGGGNLSFFDGHLEYMKQSTFINKYDDLKNRPGSFDFFGGYTAIGVR